MWRSSMALTSMILWAAPAAAQEARGPITMQWAVDAVLTSHPAMRATVARRQAAEARPAQAWALPDPMLMVEGFPAYRFGHGPEMFMFSLRQDIPLGGERGRSSEAARREARAARADSASVALDLVLVARLSFIRLSEAEQTRATRAEELELARATAELVRARVTAGAEPASSALSAAFLITEGEAALEAARGEEQAAWAALAALAGVHGSLPLTRAIELPPEPAPLQQLLDRARGARPELRALAARRAAALQRAAAASARGGPMLSLEAGYMLDLMERDGLMGTVGVSVPIFPGARTAASREAAADAVALRADAEGLARTIEGEIGEARSSLVAARARAAIVRDRLVPQAHAHHELALAEFARGQTDLFSVLDALRHHISSRLEEVMTTSQAARLQALLDRATATPFNTSNPGG